MDLREKVFEMPWWDTHSHLACHAGVGLYDGAFACDCQRGHPVPEHDLYFLLTAPYMNWMAQNLGFDVDARAREAGFRTGLEFAQSDPKAWWEASWRIYRALQEARYTQAFERGMREFHGIDLRFGADLPVEELSARIKEPYEREGFYGVYRRAAKRVNVVRGVKLVEMPYFDLPVDDEEIFRQERQVLTPALRVDAFTTLHLPNPGFRLSPERIGLPTDSLETYLQGIDACLDRAIAGGLRGLKNAYAYFGPLNIPEPDLGTAQAYVTKQCGPEGYRAFESVVLHHLLKQAAERDLPYQFHAGIARTPWCNPIRLAEQVEQNPRVRFHLLHIYPYHREAACLARFNQNAYLDPCWLSIFAPHLLREVMREWLGSVSPRKILYGVDATTIEEWLGAALIAKEVLVEVLKEKIADGVMDESQALDAAAHMLGQTAEKWYGDSSL
jgi:hypothetical protein